MDQTETQKLPGACWHCGAPVRDPQSFCLTCGASREYQLGEFGWPAAQAVSIDAVRARKSGHLAMDLAPSGGGAAGEKRKAA